MEWWEILLIVLGVIIFMFIIIKFTTRRKSLKDILREHTSSDGFINPVFVSSRAISNGYGEAEVKKAMLDGGYNPTDISSVATGMRSRAQMDYEERQRLILKQSDDYGAN